MRPFRTVLEQKIRERRLTFEEFVEYAENYAREHGELGTLGVRHLQRLVAGRRPDGRPLGPVRPETARLLEHIFGVSLDELLAPPTLAITVDGSAMELRRRLDVSRRIDASMIVELQRQLASIRRLDRQLGAMVVHDEVRTKINQVHELLTHTVSNSVREPLAALLSELCCLAGWQALDLGRASESWQYYDEANAAALESGTRPFMALAAAGRAFVLIEIDETTRAVEVMGAARELADRTCPTLLRSWLSAAHGETLAANGQREESLRAFDVAADLLLAEPAGSDGPYIVLDPVHLARWRGHALARCADPAAVDILTRALGQLDRTFTRAETALRVDLAAAFINISELREAHYQAECARRLATEIGSTRQIRRIGALTNPGTYGRR